MVFYTRKPFLLLLLLAVHCVSSKREQKITVCVVTQWERSQSIVGRAEKEKPAEKWTMFILKIFCFPSIASNQFNFFFLAFFPRNVLVFIFASALMKRHSFASRPTEIPCRHPNILKAITLRTAKQRKNVRDCFLLSRFHGNHLHTIFSWI